MKFSVIIVTYRSASCIAECLSSIRSQVGADAEIIVIDNASPDDTAQVVKQSGGGIQLIENRENVGFGRACNQGFNASQGQYLFMLNPDARLESPEALARIDRAMASHPQWGLAGTRVTSVDGLTESHPAMGYPNQRHAHRDFSRLPGKIAWVLGASMIIRRDAFAKVEGFDPGFFLYSEETDLCLRLRQAGWEIGFIPEVTVRHIGGASERGNDPYETRLRSMAGLHRFWSKHYPWDDVLRMVRLDRFRAGFRKRWYGMMVRFQGRDSRAWAKQREYAAINEASRRFLKQVHQGSPPKAL